MLHLNPREFSIAAELELCCLHYFPYSDYNFDSAEKNDKVGCLIVKKIEKNDDLIKNETFNRKTYIGNRKSL